MDYSIPIGDEESWDKVRACVLPMTIVTSFFYLNGNLNYGGDIPVVNSTPFKISMYSLIPGFIISILIYFKTSKSKGPRALLTI